MARSGAGRVAWRRRNQGAAGAAAHADPLTPAHPKKSFDLTEALIRRGYGDSNIEAVPGGNFRRLPGTIRA